MMPSVLQLLYWISQLQCFCGELTLKSGTFWKEIFFGITFPVSIVFRFVKRGTITLEILICFPMPTFLWRYIAAQTPDIVIHAKRFFNNVTSLHFIFFVPGWELLASRKTMLN